MIKKDRTKHYNTNIGHKYTIRNKMIKKKEKKEKRKGREVNIRDII